MRIRIKFSARWDELDEMSLMELSPQEGPSYRRYCEIETEDEANSLLSSSSGILFVESLVFVSFSCSFLIPFVESFESVVTAFYLKEAMLSSD